MSKKGNTKKDDEDEHKGILKKSSEEQRTKSKVGSRKSIKWDEINVTATLHPVGKDYGHMKIVEVPTPYERPGPEDGTGVDAMVLAKRLEEAIRRESIVSETSDDYSIDADDEDSQDEAVRKKRFKERRKEHYKEYTIAKLRASTVADSDDEDGNGTGVKKNYK